MIAVSAANYYSGFIRTDVELLRRITQVELIPPSRAPRPLAKAWAIPRAKAVYGWFADLSNIDTGLLCRLFRKRFILAVAGYELANMPEFDYGLQRRALSRMVVRRCFRLADVLTFLHEGLREEAAQFDPPSLRKMVVVPPGYEASFWTPEVGRTRSVVTSVVTAESLPRFRVKGGPIVLRIARRFPSVPFVLVGIKPEISRLVSKDIPGNVRLATVMAPGDLRALFQDSLAVLQPSAREVFPNAVCEAMLCGAIPIVSPLGVMQEVVGEVGFVAVDSTVESYVNALRDALTAVESRRAAARERIRTHYPLEARLRAMQALLAENTSSDPNR